MASYWSKIAHLSPPHVYPEPPLKVNQWDCINNFSLKIKVSALYHVTLAGIQNFPLSRDWMELCWET